MATFGLTGSLRLAPSWSDALGSSTLSDATTFLHTFSLANGTDSGQADCYWRDVRTIAASGSDQIDTLALPLNVLGGSDTIEMSQFRLLYVKNLSDTANLTFNVAAESFDLMAGGVLLWSAPSEASNYPWVSQYIELDNQSTTTACIYEILLVGVLPV